MFKNILLAFCICFTSFGFAQNGKNKQQYIIMLRVTPQYQDQNNWTENTNKIVEAHFMNLQRLKSEGNLILAGRTQTDLKETFGIVIVEVDSEEAAIKIMQNDPAVAGGVMSGEVFPYKVALAKDTKM